MPAGGYVPTLIAALEARLNALDEERRAIRRALKALEGRHQDEDRVKSSLREAVLERLRIAPSTRASLLALDLGADVADLNRELEDLKHAGAVTRSGLGWRLLNATDQ
jgi:hypothetical protein